MDIVQKNSAGAQGVEKRGRQTGQAALPVEQRTNGIRPKEFFIGGGTSRAGDRGSRVTRLSMGQHPGFSSNGLGTLVQLRQLENGKVRASVDYGAGTWYLQQDLPPDALDLVRGEPNWFCTEAQFKRARFGQRQEYCSDNLSSIASVFLDLDLFRSDDSREAVMQSDGTVQAIIDRAADVGLPAPRVTHSGRGYYLHWMLDAPQWLRWPSERRRWRRVVQMLMRVFEQFGPDRSVNDPTRILRVPGSINPKAPPGRQEVRIIRQEAERVNFAVLEATLAEFDRCNPIAPWTTFQFQQRPQQEPHRTAKTSPGVPGTRPDSGEHLDDQGNATMGVASLPSPDYDRGGLPDPAVWHHPQAIRNLRSDPKRYVGMSRQLGEFLKQAFKSAGARHRAAGCASYFATAMTGRLVASDLVLLLQMRGARQGERDQFIFWILNFLALGAVTTSQNLADHASQLVRIIAPNDNEFAESMALSGALSTLSGKIRVRERMRELGQTGREPVYTPRMSYLVSIFQASAEEQSYMRCLIDETEQDRRKRIRLARKRGQPDCTYMHDAALPSARREQRSQRDQQIVEMHVKGQSAAHISQCLGVARSTVYRVLKRAQDILPKASRASQQPSAAPIERHLPSALPPIHRPHHSGTGIAPFMMWKPVAPAAMPLPAHLQERTLSKENLSSSVFVSHFGKLTRLGGDRLVSSAFQPAVFTLNLSSNVPRDKSKSWPVLPAFSLPPNEIRLAGCGSVDTRARPGQPTIGDNDPQRERSAEPATRQQSPLAWKLVPRHHLSQADCEVPTDARERGQAIFELALELWQPSMIAEAGAPEGPQQHMGIDCGQNSSDFTISTELENSSKKRP